ncbi:head-tail connector protein [Budvicia aquatica]|uniref:Phage gp6-like head-tail connector protein n=2 Tax=Budvicia aquatica TaxID=82979 RepID=A0A2C6DP94_9GAMM|nr:head-tail connector protein [Budvicia aquatica]PHI31037.1 phage gp6-like head-tail connector protein [Budvicia aquatica]
MINLELIKAHCRLDPDFNDDDNLLGIFQQAAFKYVENKTNRVMYLPDQDPPEGDNLLMDGDIVTAMLLLIGHWYENRESVIIGTQASVVPIATDILLQPYRVYGL